LRFENAGLAPAFFILRRRKSAARLQALSTQSVARIACGLRLD
jgi:hypothetical protein